MSQQHCLGIVPIDQNHACIRVFSIRTCENNNFKIVCLTAKVSFCFPYFLGLLSFFLGLGKPGKGGVQRGNVFLSLVIVG